MKLFPRELEVFTDAYITSALWSTNDESTPEGGEPLDSTYSPEDVAPEAYEAAKRDCAIFLSKFNDVVMGDNELENAGHDFWLTRNRHGSGFWDGDWNEPFASDAVIVSQSFKELHPYVGDDGNVYGFGE